MDDEEGGTDEEDGTDEAERTVRVVPDGAVTRLVLDRPRRLNGITDRMLRALDAALDSVEADEDVRAVLLSGAGDRAFSVGADVRWLSALDPSDATTIARVGQSVFGRLEGLDVPVVAAVDGYCLGGGLELACCADLRVASDRSEFGHPEHDLGLSPAWGATQRLPRLLGESRAKEILFTADRYNAATMADYGLLVEVTAPADLDGRATDLARDLAAGPPLAHRETKRAVHRGRDDVEAGLDAEAAGFGRLLGTGDFREGVAAFLADRGPAFEGR